MTWNRRYQVKSYLRSALWIIPFVAVPPRRGGSRQPTGASWFRPGPHDRIAPGILHSQNSPMAGVERPAGIEAQL
jgi:hypothetical protein